MNMFKILLTGWKPGLRKISVTKLLQEYAELSLTDAKSCVDRLLVGQEIGIVLPSIELAEAFLYQASNLGVVCKLVVN